MSAKRIDKTKAVASRGGDARKRLTFQNFAALNELAISPRLGNFKAEMIYWGYFKQKWWRNYLHTHSFFEICYAYAGAGTFEMLGTMHDIRAGDVFIAKPGEAHEIISSRKNPMGIYFWAYTLVPDRSRGNASAAGEAASIDALLDRFIASNEWVSHRTFGIGATLELLADEIVSRRAGYTTSIMGLTAKLLLDTARSVVDLPASAPETSITAARDPSDAIVRTAVRYLRDNYARPIGVRDVAAQVHLSERHLSRLFLQRTGVSILDHLTTVRIDIASQLLLAREMPIKQVAAACGYPDVRYFTTLFKRKTGLTPAAFRETGGTKFLRNRRHLPRG